MKDQVDALASRRRPGDISEFFAGAGVAATRCADLYNGEYQLLYVAPERLMLRRFSTPARMECAALSPSTKRIASANGATIFGPDTARSPRS